MMPIVTANQWFGSSPVTPAPTWQAFYQSVILPYCSRNGLSLTGQVDNTNPLKAWVHQGFWLAACPNRECHGAEYVWEEGFYFCFSCMNAHATHNILRITFPDERQAIEELLEPRPVPNRNWLLNESLEDLVQQNEEHGISMPEVVS